MNRRRRNSKITPKAVVNAVMADLRAEGQSALIRWLSNEDHRFVMEQYAKGLLAPAAAPEPEPAEPVVGQQMDGMRVIDQVVFPVLREILGTGGAHPKILQFSPPDRRKGDEVRYTVFVHPVGGDAIARIEVQFTQATPRTYAGVLINGVGLPKPARLSTGQVLTGGVFDSIYTAVGNTEATIEDATREVALKVLGQWPVLLAHKRAADEADEADEPEPVAAPSGSLPISREYRETLFETVKKAKKALGLTSVKKKGDMGRFMRGTNMGTQVLLIERDEYGFWSLYSRDLPRSKQGMRPLTGDLKTDAQNIFKLIASTNQQTLPRVEPFLVAAQKPKKTTAAKPSEAHPYAGHQADPNAVRRINGEIVDWIEPLYPHVSPETAYVQDDYPQGRGDKRGERRTWVEFKPKKGFRFVYQTENLDRGGWWKPKPSTYSTSAIVMYLDKRDDRIYTRSLSMSDGSERFDRFLDIFPDLPLIMVARIYRDAMIGEYLSAKYGDPETAKAKWSPVIDRLKSMQTRGNRRGRRRSNPLRKVLYSGG